MKENVYNLSYLLLMKRLFLQSLFNSKRNTCLIASLLSSYMEGNEGKRAAHLEYFAVMPGRVQKGTKIRNKR